MFDHLVESVAKPNRNRRRFFGMVAIAVSVVFAAVLIADLYAANYQIGDEQFEINSLLSPSLLETSDPEPKIDRPTTSFKQRQSPQATRSVNLSRVDEAQFVPDKWSSEKNRFIPRPNEPFRVDPFAGDSDGGLNRRGTSTASSGPPASNLNTGDEMERTVPPPLPPKPPSVPTKQPATPKYVGVVNGIALELPKPRYPTAAVALNISDVVHVQVVIDETGSVISANAIKGHPILREAALEAARRSRFSPTTSSGRPVKVTGLIIYNFIR